MAAGVLAAADEADIDVPGALSIVGFDDSDLAKAVWPPLTTMRQPVRELAYAAANLMLSPDAAPQVTLEHKLMVRATTGPAPR
jgi:LacI family transcriptional regulator